MSEPLAERMRPRSLDDYVGQKHLVGPNAVLRNMIEGGRIPSFILWGPPGVGKTTLAQIIAHQLETPFYTLSAVTSGVKDVREVIERAKSGRFFNSVSPILFIDEIHRFSKSQQDSLLGAVEKGVVTLIGATTENPSFEVIPPLISRSRVVILKQLSTDQIKQILSRAIKLEKLERRISPDAIDTIASLAHGDARYALGALELAESLAPNRKKITSRLVEQALGQRLPRYDKKADGHYDIASAFIKSMRGSDETAALYYLARMIQAGEDPKFIARRTVIFASEDIGLAGNGALGLATNAFLAIERVGLPEGGIILSHVVIALCRAKKSRESYDAWLQARQLAEEFPDSPIPLFIRNAPTKLMRHLGYGKGYQWKAGYHQAGSYLPDEVQAKLDQDQNKRK